METEFKNNPHFANGLKELDQLKEKASAIRGDSEAFVEAAKRLSKVGLKDAEKLISFAKENWKSVLAATALLGISGAVMNRTGAKSSKKAAGVKKAVASAKKSITKKAKKAVKRK